MAYLTLPERSVEPDVWRLVVELVDHGVSEPGPLLGDVEAVA